MGKAIGLEIRKVFGVKLTTEEKSALEEASKVANGIKEEEVILENGDHKFDEDLKVGPSSSGMRTEISA
jgi:hypothetical protein